MSERIEIRRNMITGSDYFGYILILGGIIQALIVIFHAKWYFEIRRVKKLVNAVGEKTAKIIYLVFCVMCIAYGIAMIVVSQ